MGGRAQDRISEWLPLGDEGAAPCKFTFHDPGPPHYTEDVAPILLERCVTCHRTSTTFDIFSSCMEAGRPQSE